MIIILFYFALAFTIIYLILKLRKRNERKRRQRYTDDFVELLSTKDLEKYFKIPEEHCCNPFLNDPHGDIFFADKRNVEKVRNNTI